jgi:glutathione S-transferase
MDGHLTGKTYLVGEKCTIADLAYVNWDHEFALDNAMSGNEEAATMEQREKLYPNWAAWHKRLIGRDAVEKMVRMQREAFGAAK